MATLVFANMEAGTLSRYEVGGEAVRKTHFFANGSPVEIFEWDLLQFFRLTPPDKYRLAEDPTPTPPNAGAGTVRAAA